MRGRRASVAAAVAGLDGPRAMRERLRVLLDTLTGQLSLAAAGGRLGLGRTRVLALRRQALGGALDALAPHPVGRPRRGPSAGAVELARLQARVRELEGALQAEQVRAEVALTMPGLLRRRGGKKSTSGGAGRRAGRARS
jgi:hypothetical protein